LRSLTLQHSDSALNDKGNNMMAPTAGALLYYDYEGPPPPQRPGPLPGRGG
jgi:hypothetical protein